MRGRVLYPLTVFGLMVFLWTPARPVIAQAVPPAPAPLVIIIPQGAKLDTEFDGRDNDLLGMVKDLINGVSGPDSPKSGAATPPQMGMSPLNMLLGSNADGSLSALLKNVKHLHLVMYSLPEISGTDSNTKDVKEDPLGFYDRSFQTEGGRRLLYINGKEKLLITGFDQLKGIAVVISQGDKITVARTVGYPDMKVVGNLIRVFTGIGMENTPVVAAAPASSAPAKAIAKPVKKRKTAH